MRSAVLVFLASIVIGHARALRLGSGRETGWSGYGCDAAGGTDLVVVRAGSSYGTICAASDRGARPIHGRGAPLRRRRRGLVLGVGNGFADSLRGRAVPGVLMRNAALKFICRDVYLKVERSDSRSPRLQCRPGDPRAGSPMAKATTSHSQTVARLEGEGRVLFRYRRACGQPRCRLEHQRRHQSLRGS